MPYRKPRKLKYKKQSVRKVKRHFWNNRRGRRLARRAGFFY